MHFRKVAVSLFESTNGRSSGISLPSWGLIPTCSSTLPIVFAVAGSPGLTDGAFAGAALTPLARIASVRMSTGRFIVSAPRLVARSYRVVVRREAASHEQLEYVRFL